MKPTNSHVRVAGPTSSPAESKLSRSVLYVVMIVLVLIMVLPFLWMLSTSLKSQQYILSTTPQLIPDPLTFESYTQLVDRINLFQVVFNSSFVAIATTVGQVIIAAMAAYAFSRMQWRGRDAVFVLYLATMMIPTVVLVIPQFILVRSLGWVNTYSALIIPTLFNAFGVFLLRQSFLQIPNDFEEAAFVDGANHLTIFWRIVMPLSQPALATLAIFSFMGSWNAYLWPLFIARREEVMTLPVALASLQAGPRALTEWNMVMAGSVVAVLPILIVYMFAQRWFISGVISSGIKG